MFYVNCAVAAVFTALASLIYCHILQLEGYKNKGFISWVYEKGSRFFMFVVCGAVLYLLAWFISKSIVFYIIFSLGAAALLALFLHKSRIKKAKKPLVYTARVKRMLIATLVLILGASAASIATKGGMIACQIIIVPLYIVAANAIMKPIEKLISQKYLNEAKAILDKRSDLIKIGITGSYGKTSTKFILGTILSEKYDTLITPSSFNTPMGLTRVIREELKPTHEVFIAEMGAKHVGDIKELVELVQPKYGIITSVGSQHLETFGSIENITKTKYELIDGLPADGTAFFPNDGGITSKLYEQTSIDKMLYGFKDADITAINISVGSLGSKFMLFYRGQSVVCKTQLLGQHNILNILGCAAVAIKLGLSLEQIKNGIEKLQPVEHRLQILPSNNGVTVIDDAFNSNPQGAKAAMEVLSQFEGTRFVVTPGMVELGAIEEKENYEFGKHIAKAANVVFLVGRNHTRPIRKGLEDSGFNMKMVFVASTLEEASAQMGTMLKPGDVVIFENDLPDNYTE